MLKTELNASWPFLTVVEGDAYSSTKNLKQRPKPQGTHCVLKQGANEFSIKDSSDWFLFKAWMEDSGTVGGEIGTKASYPFHLAERNPANTNSVCICTKLSLFQVRSSQSNDFL